MRRFMRAVLMPLLLTAGLTLAPASFAATDAAPGTPVIDSGETDDTMTTDSRIGVLAAAGCGLFVRLTIVTGGTQVGIIVGAVACCALALVDSLAPAK